MILRRVARLLRWAKNLTRRHRNSLTRPSHGPKILSKQTILGSTLASTSPGMLIAAATGFITYFNDEVASAIQSVDLSNTPLSPISGLQEALVRSLEGNYCFTWIWCSIILIKSKRITVTSYILISFSGNTGSTIRISSEESVQTIASASVATASASSATAAATVPSTH